MNEVEQPNRNGKIDTDPNVTSDVDAIETEKVLPPPEPGLGERIRKLFQNFEQRGPKPRKELAKDRTHSLALLIGGTVGAVLLFIGVFSTPTRPTAEQSSLVQHPTWETDLQRARHPYPEAPSHRS
jgi:hypothetical protein